MRGTRLGAGVVLVDPKLNLKEEKEKERRRRGGRRRSSYLLLLKRSCHLGSELIRSKGVNIYIICLHATFDSSFLSLLEVSTVVALLPDSVWSRGANAAAGDHKASLIKMVA